MTDKKNDKTPRRAPLQVVLRPVLANQYENDAYHMSVLCGTVKLACSPVRVLLEKSVDKLTAAIGDGSQWL